MLFTITGKHIEVTDAVRSYAEKKTSKLPRYYDSINQIEVIINDEPNGNTGVEMIARAEHSKIFVVKESGDNTYKCIDVAVHKLQRQLMRKKSKERNNKHTGGEQQNIRQRI